MLRPITACGRESGRIHFRAVVDWAQPSPPEVIKMEARERHAAWQACLLLGQGLICDKYLC
jgi:hypothetical protein